MKIGVIYCCYGNPEYISNCLQPWVEARRFNDSPHEIKIAAVHGQFKEYHDLGIEDNDGESCTILLKKYDSKIIDYLYTQNHYILMEDKTYQTEAEIRDKGLQWLLKQNCDFIWLLDNDEFYTVEQINNIINYIQKEEFVDWFSIPFKNYIFSGQEWISGFCPPRVFRTKLKRGTKDQFNLYKCVWDNDFEYMALNIENNWPKKDGYNRLFLSYKELANKFIPNNLISGGIKHLTWTHENGAAKEKYQRLHFNGECSYKFNYDTKKLEFNLEHYRKHNIPLPEIYYDN